MSSPTARARGRVLGLVACAAAACGDGGGDVRYVDRPSCLACHRPLDPDGTAAGIEAAHPPVGGVELSCTDCHGGDPDARRQSEAHVPPGPGEDPFVRELSPRELDALSADRLRFVNPGDLRVASRTCGAGPDPGAACHSEIVEAVLRSPMATAAGELDVPRLRAGSQATAAGIYGVADVLDPGWPAGGGPPGTVQALRAFEEAPVAAGEQAVGPYQDLMLSKVCLDCHLLGFGPGRHAGTYRSSGCTACHMPYADDGLYRGADPMIDRGAPARPERHALVASPPTGACLTCHHGGGRIGPSYLGLREVFPGGPAAGAAALPEALWGRPAGGWVADMPADVHAAAGMTCADCHRGKDVHGDGRIWTEGAALVGVRCQDCHLPAGRPGAAGDAAVHGPDHASLRCDTCHSAWIPTCDGCHVSVDLSAPQTSALTGALSLGRVDLAAAPDRHATDELVLVLDHEGRIAPSMPAERLRFSAIDGLGRPVLTDRERPGRGRRAFPPHTIGRTGPFSACAACHPTSDADADRVRRVAGRGAEEAGVVIGHGARAESRPLPDEVLGRMLGVRAPAR